LNDNLEDVSFEINGVEVGDATVDESAITKHAASKFFNSRENVVIPRNEDHFQSGLHTFTATGCFFDAKSLMDDELVVFELQAQVVLSLFRERPA